MIEFSVYGAPVPQGSTRALVTKGGRAIVTNSNSNRLALWRNDVVAAAVKAIGDAPPIDVPVGVVVWFFMPRPKSHYRTGANAHVLRDNAPALPAKMPDLDKLIRAILDALTVSGAIADDALVCSIHASKEYADGAMCPGVRIGVLT
jgi:crossover junction endodeoxyribonuclease RusA